MTSATSDPLSYTCACPAATTGGSVLLFYRYYHNDPPLTPSLIPKASTPSDVASFHRELTSRLELGGKLRFASEGFNVTLGGTAHAIDAYISACVSHWSFSGLSLSTSSERNAFFKPTPGCACAFSNRASIRVTSEITPLGITNYTPESWSAVTPLSPAAFHEMCMKNSKDVDLVDMRNHYESKIGYFVTGKGEIAVRPGIRRFSQWPGFVSRHLTGKPNEEQSESESGKKQILTYCTGGIRCEKGARWMQEAMAEADGDRQPQVFTLDGGIVAYLAWIEGEIRLGRKDRNECLFKGKNYVFDGRGSIGLSGNSDHVAVCHGCATPEDRLGKCRNERCHLVLVICEQCESSGGLSCCKDCTEIELRSPTATSRSMCLCEQEREQLLWGGSGAKISRKKKAKRNN